LLQVQAEDDVEGSAVRVLVACEFSATVRDTFRTRGHDAWSCDLLPTEGDPAWHWQEDVLSVLARERFDLMIAHPPCTYLSRSGWHWVNKPDCAVHPLKGRPRRKAAIEAANFFRCLLHAPIARIAVENPRPIKHVALPPSSQIIQPWQFGHGEVKETHLWLKNLPPLSPTNIVEGREAKVHKASPGKDRWKVRSRTYSGIAEAMADQWGSL
jgi:hypothetical protein